MPRINLLPWREQQRTERKKSFAVGMIAALVAAGVVTFIGWLFMNGLVDAQTSRNQKLTDEIKVLDKKIEEINSLEQQKKGFIDHIQIIGKLQRSRPEIVHVFDTFVQTIPDGTYLTGITQTGQRFKINGVAQSSNRVSSFMSAIESSQWLKDVELDLIRGNAAGGQDFTLYANQVTSLADKPAAGRKTTAGAK